MGTGEVELLRDADRPAGWLVSVGGVPQSYVDLDDPTYLEFDYVRWMAAVIDAAARPGEALSVVHVGGAGFTLPRYIAASRPRSRQVVLEPDRELTALVRRRLPLPRHAGIRVRAVPGRPGMAALGAGRADVVAVDAYLDGRVPADLVSTEFLTEVARVLRPGGVYVANLADGPPLPFARRAVATALHALGEATVVAEPAVLRRRRFGNVVLAAATGPLPLAEVTRAAAGGPFRAAVVGGPALRRFTGGARPFTDADAEPSPVAPHGTWALRDPH